MSCANFVHLRIHSAYSLSEGAIHIEDIVRLCTEYDMPAVAITDKSNMFGALEFSETASSKGVQPIVGCELNIGDLDNNRFSPMVFLAKNQIGYRNLLKLISQAYLERDNTDTPQVTYSILEHYSEGIIALSGGPTGPIGQLLIEGKTKQAREFLSRQLSAFGDRLYIELHRHGRHVEEQTEPGLLDLAYSLDIPLVATNEVFFSTVDMHEAHEVLMCISDSSYLSEADRRQLTREHYFKSVSEMRDLFSDLPEAVDNTVVIAQRCSYKVSPNKPMLPPYTCNTGRGENDELKSQAKTGLEERLTTQVLINCIDKCDSENAAIPYRQRLQFELDIIIQMGFAGYFLIVADFIKWAKKNKIPVGPGRGSGAGSLVAWALQITDLDPLKWGLLFERFLNPERVSMPDFDIDFCQDRRDEVIRYVQNKYGQNHVAQIITFGKLQARAVLRDCGRVLEIPYGYVDKICKLVPNNPANPLTLHQAINSEPQLRKLISEDPNIKKLFNIAKKLEGLYRHASTHAAGLVIADRPLDELIPLYYDPRSNMPVTGFNMKYVELAGLVKFDFLGLKTLTVLSTTEQLVRNSQANFNLETIPLDDPQTYKMIGKGETTGVFQLESSGMRDVLRSMQPDKFEDIIAVVALYRPGPMDNIPSYVSRKHKTETPEYLHPILEPILKETFGIMIYQEQVMQIAQELAGFTLGRADLLRRAMGKKIQSEMDRQRQAFIDGAKAKGVDNDDANKIFNQVDKFAGYGFNKSHAAAYALIAYQTAYMKANYPAEFLAASMTLDRGNTEKLSVFLQELKRLKIPLLGPNINRSETVFKLETANGKKGIRYALTALKNVGEGAMTALVKERQKRGPYTNITNFAERLDAKTLNRRQLEYLASAGAFDCIESNRYQIHNGVEKIIHHANAAHDERQSNQIGLFSGELSPRSILDLPIVTDWSPMERLRQEFTSTGFYLSSHPIDGYSGKLKSLNVVSSQKALMSQSSRILTLAGTLMAKKERTSSKGNKYAFIQFTDPSGSFEVTAFSETLALANELLEVGNSLLIKTTVQKESAGEIKLLANQFLSLDKFTAINSENVRIVIAEPTAVPSIQNILADQQPGQGKVRINTRPDNTHWHVDLELAQHYALTADAQLALRNLPGVINIETFETH